MHSVQRDVEEFHSDVIGIPPVYSPQIRRPMLRANLIAEEARETLEAITGQRWIVESAPEPSRHGLGGDLVEAIDGMCDLLCVVYGTAAEFGVDLEPFWNEVHFSNMQKAGGSVRPDGKKLKPEGWVAPDIAGILANLKTEN